MHSIPFHSRSSFVAPNARHVAAGPASWPHGALTNRPDQLPSLTDKRVGA
ncbi:hypothetical protein ACP70R_035855 [Stipagrostis hirtigluma subsp. patula]